MLRGQRSGDTHLNQKTSDFRPSEVDDAESKRDFSSALISLSENFLSGPGPIVQFKKGISPRHACNTPSHTLVTNIGRMSKGKRGSQEVVKFS